MRTVIISNEKNRRTRRLSELLRFKFGPQMPVVVTWTELQQKPIQESTELVVAVLTPTEWVRQLSMLSKIRRSVKGKAIAVGPSTEGTLILTALREGADFYLDENDLENGLGSILTRIKRESSGQILRGKTIAVLGSSGGAGASTVAVNVAAALARRQESVLLIDMNLSRGDQATLLNCKPVFTLADVCAQSDRVDPAMFQAALISHASGIQLLAGPKAFYEVPQVTSMAVQKALIIGVSLFPHCVVDLENCYQDNQQAILKAANTVLLVLRLDFPSLRNARRILDQLDQIGISRSAVELVGNRTGQPGELPASEVESALGKSVSCLIPNDPRSIHAAHNTGVPVVIDHPKARIASILAKLAEQIEDLTGHRMPPSSIFQLALSRFFAF